MNRSFSIFLKLVGFNLCPKEPILFTMKWIIPFVYVDSIIFFSRNQRKCQVYKPRLVNRSNTLKDWSKDLWLYENNQELRSDSES